MNRDLEDCNKIPNQSLSKAKVQAIYNKCKEIEKTHSDEIKGSTSLNKEFVELEGKVHRLFFKALIKTEVTNLDDSNSSPSIPAHEQEKLKNLAMTLYKGDDRATGHTIANLSEDTQGILFNNLYKILGSPEANHDIGMNAFLNESDFTATPKEKLEAIILSLDADQAALFYVATGNVDDLKLFYPEHPSHPLLEESVKMAATYGHIDALRFLLSGHRNITEQAFLSAVQ
ncbi:MAG: hypothetical protein EBZ47_09385, partial [Chlamydiae bacterium]|nr:hypothetical protein [Chlamydiota bacterium]